MCVCVSLCVFVRVCPSVSVGVRRSETWQFCERSAKAHATVQASTARGERGGTF